MGLGVGVRGGRGGREAREHLIFRSAVGPWAHTPHASWPPWSCLLATIKVGLDLMSLFPFQADQRLLAFLERPSMTVTTFSSSRTCVGRPPSQRCGCSGPSEGPRGAQDPLLGHSHGHLTQTDQLDALPGTWPWDILAVLGSLCGLPERFVPGTVGGSGETAVNRPGSVTRGSHRPPWAQSSRSSREGRFLEGSGEIRESSEQPKPRRTEQNCQGSCRLPSRWFPSPEAGCTSCP